MYAQIPKTIPNTVGSATVIVFLIRFAIKVCVMPHVKKACSIAMVVVFLQVMMLLTAVNVEKYAPKEQLVNLVLVGRFPLVFLH